MKDLSLHIQEALKIGKEFKYDKYKYKPETKEELRQIIVKITKQHYIDDIIDLNMIDTSKITDMSELFMDTTAHQYDISEWNVSNVRNMYGMFRMSKFNGDISNWDVSNVENMNLMFRYSKFNNDISKWDVSRVEHMTEMFYKSAFNQDISQWDVSNVENMAEMFERSQFNQDISQWNISNVENLYHIFYNSKFNQDLTPWKNKIKDKNQLQYIDKYISKS